ncbi:MAG: 50S ribosomal protein L23 [Candidatus Komeilibacteria bacterium]
MQRPVITEKATYLASENKYIFEVAMNANKIEVRKAIEKLYNVNVIKVNIIRSRGKKVTYGRISGKTRKTKKAIVTLKQGQSISVYEGV